MGGKDDKEDNVLGRNKKAFHNYTILQSWEAGIELKGSEVKSCRNHQATFTDAYAKVENNEIYLHNLHIAPYEPASQFNQDPMRARRLLMKRHEILKIAAKMNERGLTLVPLKMYVKKNYIKVELGLGKGKTHGDKRDTLRKRQDDLETRRAVSKYK